MSTDGLDLRLNTSFDLGGAGKLENRLTVSYINKYEIELLQGLIVKYDGLVGYPDLRANLSNRWSYGDFSFDWSINYIDGQLDPDGYDFENEEVIPGSQVGGYATNDVQVSWKSPWNATIAVGATNVGDRYPELVDFDGRPWNFNLYDAYGRTVYFRYTQTF